MNLRTGGQVLQDGIERQSRDCWGQWPSQSTWKFIMSNENGAAHKVENATVVKTATRVRGFCPAVS